MPDDHPAMGASSEVAVFMRGFNLLRACFLLLAVVILAQVATVMAGAASCFYMFLIGTAQLGACSSFSEAMREMWSEILAAILALLLAARGPPPEPPPPT